MRKSFRADSRADSIFCIEAAYRLVDSIINNTVPGIAFHHLEAFDQIGAVTADDIGCSREALRAAMLHMHEMRKRFTIVDLAWMLGVLPGAADAIISEWLTP